MKQQHSCNCQGRSARRRAEGGASKLVLWIIGLVGFLAYLTIGRFPIHQQPSASNRTTATLAAVMSGLEQYHEKFGKYPEPTEEAERDNGTFDGVTMNRGAAAMLYQAITGDGSDYVKSDAVGEPSDGKVDEREVVNSINSNLPPHMIKAADSAKGAQGPRYLVDGFGRPFQYTRGGQVEAVNERYDIWSYGNVKAGPVSRDAGTKKDAQKTAGWIKNW